MDEDDLVDQPYTDRLVSPVLRHVDHYPEFVAKVLQTLVAGVEMIHLEASQEQLDAIRQECVSVVLHHDTLEDLFVGSGYESLQDEHDGNNIFLFSPAETEHRATVRQVVECVRRACLVGAHTAYLHRIWCVRGSAVDEGWPDQRNDMMSSGENEIPDETFVSVDDKVTTEFFWLFVMSNEFARGHAAKVTPR